jgi:hypothetical protein
MEQGTTGGPQRKRHSGPRLKLFVEMGQRIGRGVVLDPEIRVPAKRYPVRGARLICDCGTEYEATIVKLIGKHACAKSCGCLREEYKASSTKKGRRLPDGIAARNAVRDNYKAGAQHRGHDWGLTDDEFDHLTSSACFYCGCPPSKAYRCNEVSGEFVYNGIDRKDNSLGYIPGNVLPACQACNFAKGRMSFDDFLAWIARLTEYHWFHPDVMPSRLLKGGA